MRTQINLMFPQTPTIINFKNKISKFNNAISNNTLPIPHYV